MIEQTTALTLNAEIIGVDINDGQITANVKGGDTIRITGITMETWLKEIRYLVSTFEWRSVEKQQEHRQQLEQLQDSLADVLQKINAKTEVSA
ncbi:MAG: hypothetical protein ACO3LT_01210 [Ilumatobacteraceae bacterium]